MSCLPDQGPLAGRSIILLDVFAVFSVGGGFLDRLTVHVQLRGHAARLFQRHLRLGVCHAQHCPVRTSPLPLPFPLRTYTLFAIALVVVLVGVGCFC